jgi:hypothetical protein
MKGKGIVENVARLIDSLGYNRGAVRSYFDKNDWCKKRIKMYKVELNTLGLRKYNEDLNKISAGRKELGLWKKGTALQNAARRECKLYGQIRNKNMSNILIKNHPDTITPKNLKKLFKSKSRDIYSLLRYMINKKYVKKVSRGVYRISDAYALSETQQDLLPKVQQAHRALGRAVQAPHAPQDGRRAEALPAQDGRVPQLPEGEPEGKGEADQAHGPALQVRRLRVQAHTRQGLQVEEVRDNEQG